MQLDFGPTNLKNLVTPSINGNTNVEEANHVDILLNLYHSLFTAHGIAGIEKVLFAFMSRELQQNSCLFYCNSDSEYDSGTLVLQRGSYINHRQVGIFKPTLPTSIAINNDISDGLVQNPIYNTVETNPDSEFVYTLECCEGDEDTTVTFQLNTRQFFFSAYESGANLKFLNKFSVESFTMRFGMLLHRGGILRGLLLYEKPLFHPHLNNFSRLKQFQEFVSLGLEYCLTISCATIDQLTTLHRKDYFFQVAKQRIRASQAGDKEQGYQMLIVDIDYFKLFNDTYGHLEGDICLRSIALAIKKSVRAHDLAGRFGGEEFVCLIKSNYDQGLTVAERIHQTIAKITLLNVSQGEILCPTVSIGIATYHPGEPMKDLIKRADIALYRAKRNGRNRTEIYNN